MQPVIESLYDFMLDDELYMKLYNLIERSNTKISEHSQFIEMHTTNVIDGLQHKVMSNYMKLLNYDSYAIEYNRYLPDGKDYTCGDTTLCNHALFPNYIIHDNRLAKVQVVPIYYKNGVHPGENNNYNLYYPTAYVDVPDFSSELFQFSMEYRTLSEEDIQKIMIRLYNLPLKEGFKITLYTSLCSLDRFDDLDKL